MIVQHKNFASPQARLEVFRRWWLCAKWSRREHGDWRFPGDSRGRFAGLSRRSCASSAGASALQGTGRSLQQQGGDGAVSIAVQPSRVGFSQKLQF